MVPSGFIDQIVPNSFINLLPCCITTSPVINPPTRDYDEFDLFHFVKLGSWLI